MSAVHSLELPLRPSQSAAVAYQLCKVLADIVEHEVNSEGMSRRTYLKLCGLATAVEVFSRDAARWYSNLEGEDQEVLEALEQKYCAGRGGRAPD